MAGEISTYKAFLMKGTGATPTWAKLVDIKSFPDLGDTPEMLDITTLSDGARRYIMGIQEASALEFTANYTQSTYQTLSALVGAETDYAIWFGATVAGGVATATGSDGKFSFKGYLSVHPNGGGVNEVVDMTITIAPSTVITFAAGTSG